jgi:hypothetical protein
VNYTPSILPKDPKDLLTWLARELPKIAASINEKSKRLLYATAILTPTTLAADQNDYAPAGLEGAAWLRLSATVPVNITGLKNPEAATPRMFLVSNVGAQPINLVHASTSSGAAARFNFIGAGDVPLLQNAGTVLIYDPVLSVWRALAL